MPTSHLVRENIIKYKKMVYNDLVKECYKAYIVEKGYLGKLGLKSTQTVIRKERPSFQVVRRIKINKKP